MNWSTFNLSYSLAGFLVGALIGLTGVGGGALMTPLLVLVFRVPPAIAVGTDLLFAAATKLTGAVIHGAQRSIEWSLVALLALGSLPSTFVTVMLLKRFGRSHELAHTITIVLAIMLILSAALLLARGPVARWASKLRQEGATQKTPGFAHGGAILTILTGALLGTLVSLSSVGGGALGVTAIILLYPCLSIDKVIGSDIAHAVPLTLLAGGGYLVLGFVDQHILLGLLLGSIPGVLVGGVLAPRLPEFAIRAILAALLFLASLKLILFS